MHGAESTASLPLINPRSLWLARLQRLRGARLQRFYAGEVVLREGEVPETLGVVERGAVAVVSRTPCGRVATLDVLGPADVLGHQTAASDPVPETVPGAVSLVPSEVLTVPATTAAAILHDDTVLLQGFASAIAQQMDRAHVALERALLLPVRERVGHALRDLADRFGTRVPGGTRIVLPLSQDLLASIVGATRESVNRALRELKEKGAVRTEGGDYVWMGSEPDGDVRANAGDHQERLPGLSCSSSRLHCGHS